MNTFTAKYSIRFPSTGNIVKLYHVFIEIKKWMIKENINFKSLLRVTYVSSKIVFFFAI